jgi:hypothetical protein
MSHFYGTLIGKGKTERNITGTPNTGLVTQAKGMNGQIFVHLYSAGGVDYFEIFLENNPYADSKSVSKCIARGVLNCEYNISGFTTTEHPAMTAA